MLVVAGFVLGYSAPESVARSSSSWLVVIVAFVPGFDPGYSAPESVGRSSSSSWLVVVFASVPGFDLGYSAPGIRSPLVVVVAFVNGFDLGYLAPESIARSSSSWLVVVVVTFVPGFRLGHSAPESIARSSSSWLVVVVAFLDRVPEQLCPLNFSAPAAGHSSPESLLFRVLLQGYSFYWGGIGGSGWD